MFDTMDWPKAENSFNQSEFWNISYDQFYSTILEDLWWSKFIFCLSKLDYGCESYEIQRILDFELNRLDYTEAYSTPSIPPIGNGIPWGPVPETYFNKYNAPNGVPPIDLPL
jgi:hypothetical protein